MRLRGGWASVGGLASPLQSLTISLTIKEAFEACFEDLNGRGSSEAVREGISEVRGEGAETLLSYCPAECARAAVIMSFI